MRSNRGTWARKTPRSLTTPTMLDIAWAAGFYEGEGTSQAGNRGSQTAKIAQVTREPLERLQRLFGGSISATAARGFSKRVQYVWYVCGARARGFLYTIFSFLSSRRRSQVRVALGVA